EILYWLNKAREQYLSGEFKLDKKQEDVHMNVEKYLLEGAGAEYGGKLHTARSRNDQVITDSKLYLRKRLLEIKTRITKLQETFLTLAKDNPVTVIPGYTHTQEAQPITLGYWATAYVSMFMRDIKRLDDAYLVVDTNPLGSAALAGTSFPIDRRLTAKLLGFSGLHKHSLDVISSRDYMVQVLSALAIHMSNISKLSEELVYWSTFEFGFLELDDSYTAGSSIMPQKKNPCVAELARGRTGRVYGTLMQLLTMLKGLPMGYNRDLQEDKPPLWHAMNVVESTLIVVDGMISTMKIKKERLKQVSGANFNTATELANYLVREKGLSFRRCHEIVGNLVGSLHRQGETFEDTESALKILSENQVDLDEDIFKKIVDPNQVVQGYESEGSTNPKQVSEMIGEFEDRIRENKKQVNIQSEKISQAEEKTQNIVAGILAGKDINEIEI
ncbi:MAG: argininosuccinate lyase, partial [Candidatus Altiarchaeales archaeon]|nr:argininosuccinate lyase [Candidatus Altiarchaeales archaeon]